MKAIDQIINEMTYKAKKITPSINRRISLSFRDSDLKGIFEENIVKVK